MARVAVVLGDPTGIGPEVLAKVLADPPAASQVLLIGDRNVWAEAQQVAGVYVPVRLAERPGPIGAAGVPFLERPVQGTWRVGEMSPAAGRAAAQWLKEAVRLAMAALVDGVVFAPLNKAAIIRAGYAVRDEYELCAALAGVSDYDEVNAIPHPRGAGLLWVARATSHVPFRAVSSLLTAELVGRAIQTAHRMARAGGEAAPRIGVAALNPHAGEAGLLGDEEARVVAPAVVAAAAAGMAVSGPHPADHVFRRARAGEFDAVVALYHDQAQIATKLMGFERGVSVGVGFPFVLATPSHGTAFDIAGQGIADPGPMRQALLLAERLAAAPWSP